MSPTIILLKIQVPGTLAMKSGLRHETITNCKGNLGERTVRTITQSLFLRRPKEYRSSALRLNTTWDASLFDYDDKELFLG